MSTHKCILKYLKLYLFFSFSILYLSIVTTFAVATEKQDITLLANNDVQDFTLAFGGEDFVSIATGKPLAIHNAPAVASIVSSSDIRAMGARTLTDVLETIPGLHVSLSPITNGTTYLIRGIHSDYNPHVLLLFNGTPITSLLFGNRGQAWGGMPVENIARIEIIRGPGSAIYGADAFAGVINIISKTGDDIQGTEFGIRGGSFNTRDAWVLNETQLAGFDVATSLQIQTTNGHREIIEGDFQTFIDSNPEAPTNASLAPGPTNNQSDRIDASVNLSKNKWLINMDYQGRRNLGTGPGVAQALDPVGKAESDRYNLEVTYHDPRLSEFWDVTLTTNYQDISNKLKLVLFPPGAFDGTYPDGMIANPSAYERHVRLNVSGFYSGFTNHLFRIGTGLHYGDQYRVEEIKNINPDRVLLDVTDTADVFTPEVRRGVVYGFLQDEWNFNNDWNLTAGLRLDNYSDFGTTINPRLALVHQINFDTTTKLLYGRAFRPPSFAELHNKNNPSTYGNKDLQPETINTYEWIVDYHPIARLNSRMGFFYYNMKNIIQFVKDPASTTRYTAQNLGERTGYGFEWETQWRWNNTAKVMLNYAFQKSHDETSNSNIGYAPQHQVYVRSDWNISNHWATTTQINWVVDRLRGAGDERSMINDYATVDFSLRYQTALKHWDFGLTSKNIFNTDAREPSPTPGYIPNDLPLSGRSVYLEIRHAL